MKLKVCGMKYGHNITDVAALQPDFLGFIFFEDSARHMTETIPQISDTIKRVGVFVDAAKDAIQKKISAYELDLIQLHGNESEDFCRSLLKSGVEIMKVFSVDDNFDFDIIKPYEEVCDYFLFDTKGPLPGGNGYAFDWTHLKNYPSQKPYFLSGGIGLRDLDKIKEFMKTDASKYCYAVDVNSRFEIEPGLKKIDEIRTFKEKL